MTLSDDELLDVWATMICGRRGGTRHLLDLFPGSSELDSVFRSDNIRDRIQRYLEEKGHVIKGCTRKQYEFEFETGRRPLFDVL